MNSSNEIYFWMLLLNCTLVSLGEEPENAEGDTLTLKLCWQHKQNAEQAKSIVQQTDVSLAPVLSIE